MSLMSWALSTLRLWDYVDQAFMLELSEIYKDTINSNAALEMTTETLACCIHLFDGDDKAFYAKLFVIIFDFTYDDLDKQDQTARKQTLENLVQIHFAPSRPLTELFYRRPGIMCPRIWELGRVCVKSLHLCSSK